MVIFFIGLVMGLLLGALILRPQMVDNLLNTIDQLNDEICELKSKHGKK